MSRETPDKNEWNPETADLRDGETTDVDSHARRNAEQLRMGEKDPEDDDVVTDGGQGVRSEWSLVCTDCDWKDELVTEGHPRDGPPSEVEDRVREHKGTVDWSHVVRVEGRVADEDQEIDPSLLTDGGQSVDDTDHAGPSDPSWAGTFSGDLWVFVRDGRWHAHDADTGELLGIIPLFEPLNIRYDVLGIDRSGGDPDA